MTSISISMIYLCSDLVDLEIFCLSTVTDAWESLTCPQNRGEKIPGRTYFSFYLLHLDTMLHNCFIYEASRRGWKRAWTVHQSSWRNPYQFLKDFFTTAVVPFTHGSNRSVMLHMYKYIDEIRFKVLWPSCIFFRCIHSSIWKLVSLSIFNH